MSRAGLNVSASDIQSLVNAINTELEVIDGRMQNLTDSGLLAFEDVIISDEVPISSNSLRSIFSQRFATAAAKTRLITFKSLNSIGTYLTSNAELNANSIWNRDDTTLVAWMVSMGPTINGFSVNLAAAGANPITWTEVLAVDSAGKIVTGTWNATKVGLAYGGTNADLSATGGTSKFLKQASSGAAITVVQPASTDLSDVVAPTSGGTPTLATSSAATWTLGSVTTFDYQISGKRMTVWFEIDASSVSAGTAAALRFTIPASKTAAAICWDTYIYQDNGGAPTVGGCRSVNGQTYIELYHTDLGGTNWAASTTATTVRGRITFEIQ